MAVRNQASTEEVLVVLVIAGLVAAAISHYISESQAAAADATQSKALLQKQQQKRPQIIKDPVFSDVGPGWGGGRWLGHGDFVFRNGTDHPFGRLPQYSGHPTVPTALPQAPPMRMPPPGMPAFGYGPSI